MPSCAFKKCFNDSTKKNKSHGITFHSFPKDDVEENKWIVIVRQQRNESDWMPTKYSRLCSVHFNPQDMYTTSKGMRKLSAGAVPHLQTGVKLRDNSDQPGISTSLKKVDIADPIDTPATTCLKSKVKRLSTQNKTLQMQNKVLKDKIKRLEKRCSSLKLLVVKLKRKFL